MVRLVRCACAFSWSRPSFVPSEARRCRPNCLPSDLICFSGCCIAPPKSRTKCGSANRFVYAVFRPLEWPVRLVRKGRRGGQRTDSKCVSRLIVESARWPPIMRCSDSRITRANFNELKYPINITSLTSSFGKAGTTWTAEAPRVLPGVRARHLNPQTQMGGSPTAR